MTKRRHVAVVAALLALTGCAAGHPRAGDSLLPLPVPQAVAVRIGHVPGVGAVLVDGNGRTLYMFPPDAGSRVTCTGPCAGTWPPLVIADGAKPTAAGRLIAADVSTLPDPNSGARVVTYAGYPLYRYAGDVRAGTANGQALFLNGGPWYALTASGDPVTTTPGSSR